MSSMADAYLEVSSVAFHLSWRHKSSTKIVTAKFPSIADAEKSLAFFSRKKQTVEICVPLLSPVSESTKARN